LSYVPGKTQLSSFSCQLSVVAGKSQLNPS